MSLGAHAVSLFYQYFEIMVRIASIYSLYVLLRRYSPGDHQKDPLIATNNWKFNSKSNSKSNSNFNSKSNSNSNSNSNPNSNIPYCRLCFKAGLSAKPLICKKFFIVMQILGVINFYKKGFVLSLVLKVRDFETRKWPISILIYILNLQKFYNRLSFYVSLENFCAFIVNSSVCFLSM